MSQKQRISTHLASVIARNAFAPNKPFMISVSNAQVMTEGIASHESIPIVGDILDLKWIKENDEQADYELGKNFLSTNGEVLKVVEFADFILVTVKLLPIK